MIKNDRQYKVTKTQLRTFQEAAEVLASIRAPKGVDPVLIQAQRSAIEAQVEELVADIAEYEALREGKIRRFVIDSFADLPVALIKGRIAAGLTHKELAVRLQVKEQQLQRWEANDYAGASIETLKQVFDAVGIESREELFVPNKGIDAKRFLRNLATAGIPSDLLLKRLIPAKLLDVFKGDMAGVGLREMFQTASIISRVFTINIGDLLEFKPPVFSMDAVASARFKLPARANPKQVNAYTVYANYLAAFLVDCFEREPSANLPDNARDLHRKLTSKGSPISFSKLLNFAWDCGLIVLPLRDSGAFHGAVWKIRDRFVIVLKQGMEIDSRWLYDLLHELGHVASKHINDNIALVEEDAISPEMGGTDEEEQANEWAENALFGGKSEEIENTCVEACEGNLKQLKAVLPQVARTFDVSLGSLANHMAYRLAEQGQNWWGAANNLQPKQPNPFVIARDALLNRVNLHRLNPVDRELLMRALTED
jgi:transcriptional regulator with XRE-family HTH domain